MPSRRRHLLSAYNLTRYELLQLLRERGVLEKQKTATLQ